MSNLIVIVTFVIAGANNMIFTGNAIPLSSPAMINASGIASLTAYSIPRPTDRIEIVTFNVTSMTEAKKRAAESVPPEPGYVRFATRGWEHGPVLVIEIPSGKTTRLAVKPRFRTVTRETTEQDGYEAVESRP